MLGLFGLLYGAVTGRSPRWPAVRKAHLAAHPFCVACGTGVFLEVHHARPVHLYPELELVTGNLRTMCREHHWQIGHCGVSWSAYNPRVDEEAALHLACVVGRLTGRED